MVLFSGGEIVLASAAAASTIKNINYNIIINNNNYDNCPRLFAPICISHFYLIGCISLSPSLALLTFFNNSNTFCLLSICCYCGAGVFGQIR